MAPKMSFLSRKALVLFVVLFFNSREINGFNYLDYANLFDGIVHLNGVKIAGRETWSSDSQNWKAWEFLGLRYGFAERFQPPKFFDDYSLESQDHKHRTFSEPGPACVQSALTNAHVLAKVNLNKTSEDCLFLNIHLPPVNQEQTLLKSHLWPVLIFIHGGDFQGGAGHLYDGNELARDTETVVVTLNYRLGIFGFLSTEDFSAKGNWGLKDVIMAVKWVRQNIGRFGADISKIVLAGDGAGGAMVSLAMMDEDVREILSGIIVMSGSALHPKYGIDSPRTAAMDLAKSTGCPVDSTRNLIACLRNKNATQLLLADSTNKNYGLTWVPTVDWDIIPFTPQWVLHSSSWKFNGSVLQGFSTQKSLGFLTPALTTGFNFTGFNKSSAVDREQLYHFAFSEALSLLQAFISQTLKCNATKEAVDKVLRHYLNGEAIQNSPVEAVHVEKAVQRFLLDVQCKLSIYEEAMEYAKNPALLSDPHSYQLYRLEYDESSSTVSPQNNQTNSKATESVDVAFLFGGSIGDLLLGSNRELRVTEEMRHLVGTFVKQGRAFGTPFDQHNGNLLQLGKFKKWEILKDSSIPEAVHFWKEYRSNACSVE